MQEFQARVGGRGGVVLVSPKGDLGWAFDTPAMAVAWIDAEVGHVRTAGV